MRKEWNQHQVIDLKVMWEKKEESSGDWRGVMLYLVGCRVGTLDGCFEGCCVGIRLGCEVGCLVER